MTDHISPGLPWEWESVGFPMGIPIWDGNGNDFKPMGIPICGFLWVFLWVSVSFLGACLISGTGWVKIPNSRDGIIKFQNVLSRKLVSRFSGTVPSRPGN